MREILNKLMEQYANVEIKFLIFVLSAVLLVPFVYAFPAIPEVCAVPPSSGFSSSGTCGAKTTNADGFSKQTCCWKQRTGSSAGPGPEVNVCQTCYQGPSITSPLSCNEPVTQAIKLPEGIRPEQNEGVLDAPSTT